MLRYIISGLMFSLVLVTTVVSATESTREILTSKVLGEDRPLNIVLPADYSSDKTYPVVYVLDGGNRRLPNMAEGMHGAHPIIDNFTLDVFKCRCRGGMTT